ncbi:lysine transporter LysE [Zhengella mangrovi]|uniref:Lysine transporter LysE n=1 Tax=Zhengella mangrovi TaxID=1982044 RepID=A0A2G1QMY3_9HYPH|nr:LysE family translocator [Zhengella mangrovi]PHP66862.1 lysine transporter LysE [Zhengella mangrovi]
MAAFLLAVFFLLITPGPGVLSTAGVGAGYGFRPGLAYVAGLFMGNNIVALAVISGMAAFLDLYPALRFALFAVSTTYLLYLAAKIAFAGSRIAFIHSERPPGFIGGFLLQFVNPKAYVVNTALFTGFPFAGSSIAMETAIKLVLLNALWVPVHLLWLTAGTWLHRLDLAPRTHRVINFGMAAAMLAVVAIAALARPSLG